VASKTPADDIIARSDLYEKPGKSPHAFCTNLNRADDIRVLCNLKPNAYWADTTIHEIGQTSGLPFIVMEVVEGQTLREMIRSREEHPLAVRRMLEIGAQIADGLAKAHDAGIVHRDLKPENLFVGKDGHIKILDFGLAKKVEAVAAVLPLPLTRLGIIVRESGLAVQDERGAPLPALPRAFDHFATP